jgi:hypothetical protein
MDKEVYRHAIEAADSKYNDTASQVVKVTKPAKVARSTKTKAAPNIADIRARAKASTAPADMLGEALAALVAEGQKTVNSAE